MGDDRTLLIADDDKPFLARLARAMEGRGFNVDTSTKTVPAGDSDIGRVISQDPTSGKQADKGSTVKIVVGVAATSTTSTPPTSSSTP